jgi:hypothetical protein
MRILVAHPGPQFSVQDVYTGWVEGLRAVGADVHVFNLGDRLAFYDSVLLPVAGTEGEARKALTGPQAIELATNGLAAALWKIRPEVLLVVSGFFADTDLLDHARRYGTKVVMLHTESPYEDSRQLVLSAHADLSLLNDPVSLDLYEAVGQAVYMPHAYRPAVHCPGPAVPELVCDLGFVGTGYPSRVAFLEAMDLTGLDVLLGGNWQSITEDSPLRTLVGHEIDECMDNTEAVELYRSARVGLNLYRSEREAEPGALRGWAMGPREVEMAACGLFFLRDPRPESDEVLGVLPAFSSPEEAGDMLRFYLDRPDDRLEMAGKARDAIMDRTFERHAVDMLRLLKEE